MSIINQYTGYGRIHRNDEIILVTASATEYFNNGDIAVVTRYHFTSAKTWQDVGFCKVIERDNQHIQYLADGDGEILAREFQRIQ